MRAPSLPLGVRLISSTTSVLNRADRIKKPLFVVHGANDPRVPLAEAEAIIATVKRNGGPVWSLIARDEGHGFAKKPNADYLFYSTVQFASRCLISPVPTPAAPAPTSTTPETAGNRPPQ